MSTSYGFPLSYTFFIELMRDATISDLRSTVNKMQGEKSVLPDLIYETEFQFERIINLLN